MSQTELAAREQSSEGADKTSTVPMPTELAAMGKKAHRRLRTASPYEIECLNIRRAENALASIAMRGVFDLKAFQRNRAVSASMPDGRQSLLRDELGIGELAFRCPAELVRIDSGIAMDQHTFESIQECIVRIRCPACQRRHEFKGSAGHLARLGRSLWTGF